jgi:hypothetical protein
MEVEVIDALLVTIFVLVGYSLGFCAGYAFGKVLKK